MPLDNTNRETSSPIAGDRGVEVAEPRFTPGLWSVFPRDPEIEGFTVETTPDQLPIAIVPKNRRPNSEAKANANLFAAAPQMLNALTAASNALRSYQYGNSATELAKEIADACDAALAKARAA